MIWFSFCFLSIGRKGRKRVAVIHRDKGGNEEREITKENDSTHQYHLDCPNPSRLKRQSRDAVFRTDRNQFDSEPRSINIPHTSSCFRTTNKENAQVENSKYPFLLPARFNKTNSLPEVQPQAPS